MHFTSLLGPLASSRPVRAALGALLLAAGTVTIAAPVSAAPNPDGDWNIALSINWSGDGDSTTTASFIEADGESLNLCEGCDFILGTTVAGTADVAAAPVLTGQENPDYLPLFDIPDGVSSFAQGSYGNVFQAGATGNMVAEMRLACTPGTAAPLGVNVGLFELNGAANAITSMVATKPFVWTSCDADWATAINFFDYVVDFEASVTTGSNYAVFFYGPSMPGAQPTAGGYYTAPTTTTEPEATTTTEPEATTTTEPEATTTTEPEATTTTEPEATTTTEPEATTTTEPEATTTTTPPSGAPSAWSDESLADFTEGEIYADAIAADGTPAPTYSITAGSLPDGLSLDPATGAITGTPTSAGSYSFTVTATNADGTISKSFSGTVAPAATTTTEPAATTTTEPEATTTTAAPTTAAPTTAAPTTAAPTTAAPTTAAPTTAAPTTAAPTTAAPTPVKTDNGVLPENNPGESQVIENGVPASVTMKIEDKTDLVLKGSGFELRISGECSDAACEIKTTTDGKPYIELVSQGTAAVSGSGFKPGTKVHIWMFSEPTYLGELTVGPDGSFSGNLNVPAVAAGEHTLQMNGTSTDGKERTANLGVVVSEALDEMPETGSDAGSFLPLGMLMVLAGIALLISSRRRPAVVRAD